MSLTRIWVHAVFATKNREPILFEEACKKLCAHIQEKADKHSFKIVEVNGYQNHIHCLILLDKSTSVSKTIQLIKGESSFWINKNQLTNQKFHWQDDYWAASISESGVCEIRKYIQIQMEHHQKKTFEEELELLLQKFGLKQD